MNGSDSDVGTAGLTTSCPAAYTRLQTQLSGEVRQDGARDTHAKEKLSTFCTAATAVPLMVMFANGVACSVSLPYQFIASTDACPPSQLQLRTRAASGSDRRTFS